MRLYWSRRVCYRISSFIKNEENWKYGKDAFPFPKQKQHVRNLAPAFSEIWTAPCFKNKNKLLFQRFLKTIISSKTLLVTVVGSLPIKIFLILTNLIVVWFSNPKYLTLLWLCSSLLHYLSAWIIFLIAIKNTMAFHQFHCFLGMDASFCSLFCAILI